jgi:hypothetical protein
MKICAAMVQFAKLKTTSQNVRVQKELLAMLSSSVRQSKAAVQTVSVPQKQLALMANVLHPVTVGSMPNALSEIIKLLVNALLVTLETLEKSVVHLPILVNPTHVELTPSVNLTEETQFVTVPKA